MSSGTLLLLFGGLLLVVALVLFLPFSRSASKENKSAQHQGGPIFRDDDRYWRGFFYYNPDDPDAIVPKRYGIGWTINFGHPLGKLFAVALLILILLPLLFSLFPGVFPATGCHTLGCTPLP